MNSGILSTVLSSLFLLSSLNMKAETQKMKVIAITQIVPHPSLDENKRGIIAQLKMEGFELGKNLKIIDENAQGNIMTANLIAKKFVGMKEVDLIIAISTPSAQAVKAAAKGSSKPIVFSAVTNPVTSGLIADLNKPEALITGAIDGPIPPPMKELQSLIKTLYPKTKRLGVLYNSAEANSAKNIVELRTALDPDFTLVERSVPNSNLVSDAITGLIGKVDAIYILSDNTIFSALPKVIQLTRKHKIPTFTSDPDATKNGILACYGYHQFDVGKTAGALAVKILRGEQDLKVKYPEKVDTLININTAKILGLKVPSHFQSHKITLVE